MELSQDKLQTPTVGVVVVNFNAGSCLERSIRSIQHQTTPPRRILLVDNHSEERPILGSEDWLSGVELIRFDRNLGFAEANNYAIKELTGCDWVALLNPDAFAASDWLSNLLNATQRHPGYASFGSRMLNAQSPEVLDGAGDVYCISGRVFNRGQGELSEGAYLEEQAVFSPCAGAALYLRSALIEVGGFDGDFFCYMEDVDLGFRLRLLGYPSLYVPSAVVLHLGSALTGRSSAFTIYYGQRNVVWVFLKNMPLFLLGLYLPLHLVLNVMTLKYGWSHGQLGTVVRAKVDALKGLWGLCKKRRRVQATRRASIQDIRMALSKDPKMTLGYLFKRLFTQV